MAQINFWHERKTASAVARWLHSRMHRGQQGGRCSNELCDAWGAQWLSRASGSYYCDECARRINDMCLMQGTRKICEFRL